MSKSSAEIRASLAHPVIDIDGHCAEYFPVLGPYLEQEGVPLDHPALQRLLPPYLGPGGDWHTMDALERARTRTARAPWWSAP